LIENYICYH